MTAGPSPPVDTSDARPAGVSPDADQRVAVIEDAGGGVPDRLVAASAAVESVG
jgi:hypothetical protein